MELNNTINRQYLYPENPENRSASAPPPSISAITPSKRPADTSSSSPKLQIHPILEAQTDSFNENIITSENTAEMSCDYSYPASTSSAQYSSSKISQTEINQMLHTLRSHRVNTLTELRRIEKVLSSINALAYYAPMTEAWNYYVSSNNFLCELRGLTRQYPFSTELLESAKWSVYNDPDSSKSWNFAWLILTKLRNDQMVAEFATKTAYEPAMWGNATPDPASATQLASVLTQEWSKAVEQMLRHWSSPPTTDSFC